MFHSSHDTGMKLEIKKYNCGSLSFIKLLLLSIDGMHWKKNLIALIEILLENRQKVEF